MVECVFCDISSGIKTAEIIYRDETVIAFLDHRPIGKGHILVIPAKHYENIEEVPEDVLCEIYKVAKKISIAIKKTYNPSGINIIQNNGIDAGQTVFHFHVHIIPRYDSGYNKELAKIAWKRLIAREEDLSRVKMEILQNI